MQHKVGDIVMGKVTGIQPYGAFVTIDDMVGLVHISELSDGFVKDVSKYANIGDTIEVKIIDIDTKTNQARLSLKAVRKMRSRKHRHISSAKLLPPSVLGFKTISDHLDEWVKQAKENLND